MTENQQRPEIATASPSQVLGTIDLFADLTGEDREHLGSLFESQRVDSHTRIYSSGEPIGHFFIVLEGGVSIFRDEVGRPTQLQARLGPGEFFGEIGLFNGDQRSSARSTAPTGLLRISKKRLLAFLADHPSVTMKIQIAAARRHSQNVAAALDLGQRKDVRIRLAKPITVATSSRDHAAVIENLSLGGLCLRDVPTSWQPETRVTFDLVYGDIRLPVAARVSWREDQKVGLAFTGDLEDREEAVQGLLRRLLE